MHKRIAAWTLGAASVLAYPCFAQETPVTEPSVSGGATVTRQPGSVGATETVTVRGTITSIDPAAREFTLKRPQGPDIVVPVGPEVRNFDQIKVGDQVVFRQAQSLVLELKKAGGGVRERVESGVAGIAKPGDKPGIAGARETRVVADVTEVDRKASTITLRGVRETRKLKVRDPSVLANINQGDQVEATLTEGEALSIETPKAR